MLKVAGDGSKQILIGVLAQVRCTLVKLFSFSFISMLLSSLSWVQIAGGRVYWALHVHTPNLLSIDAIYELKMHQNGVLKLTALLDPYLNLNGEGDGRENGRRMRWKGMSFNASYAGLVCGITLFKINSLLLLNYLLQIQIQMGICRARLTNCPGALTNVRMLCET